MGTQLKIISKDKRREVELKTKHKREETDKVKQETIEHEDRNANLTQHRKKESSTLGEIIIDNNKQDMTTGTKALMTETRNKTN